MNLLGELWVADDDRLHSMILYEYKYMGDVWRKHAAANPHRRRVCWPWQHIDRHKILQRTCKHASDVTWRENAASTAIYIAIKG